MAQEIRPSILSVGSLTAGVLLIVAVLVGWSYRDYHVGAEVRPEQFLERVHGLAGPGAIDCGYIPQAPVDPVPAACVADNLRRGSAFYVVQRFRDNWEGITRKQRGAMHQWSISAR